MSRYYFLLSLILFAVFSCQAPQQEEKAIEETQSINWSAIADSSSRSLVNTFWNTDQHYFNYTSAGNPEFHYWPQAHALDVLLDAYTRTEDDFYQPYIDQWFEGVKAKNGDTFFNDYYDDMEWNGLAMLRAFQITNDEKFKTATRTIWNDIKTGWNDNAGGGLMWVKSDPYGKNACSNGPAAILAAHLYQLDQNEEDLDWAKKIYNWEKTTLVDTTTGAVWDNINVKTGESVVNKDWIFTYNTGTFVGSAVELYKITRDTIYLNDAIKSADYTLNSLIKQTDNILKSEGTGDGGLFKGIFIRYFTELILLPDLPDATRQRYLTFIHHNAETLWNKGASKNPILFAPYWNEKPAGEVDLTVELSGNMLLEAAARIAENNSGAPNH